MAMCQSVSASAALGGRASNLRATLLQLLLEPLRVQGALRPAVQEQGRRAPIRSLELVDARLQHVEAAADRRLLDRIGLVAAGRKVDRIDVVAQVVWRLCASTT